MAVTPDDYRDLWPNGWYQPYMEGRPILYFPAINMGNYGTYGVDSAWWQIPEGYSLHGRFNKYLQRHSIKAGSEVRWKRGEAARFRFYNFAVNANATANTTNARISSASAIPGRASCSARSTTARTRSTCRCRSRTPRCMRCTCRTTFGFATS